MKKNISSTVYKILSKIDGKIYIGRTVNYSKRINSHLSRLKRKVHENYHLQRAWDKYGKDNFLIEIIESTLTKDEAIQRETYWINYYKAYDDTFGYNIVREDGNNRILSEKTRQLISENHADFRGEKGPFYGRKHTEESKRLIGEAKKGEKHPFYGKKRLEHSDNMRGSGNPFYGKGHSENTKTKISRAKTTFSSEKVSKALNLLKEGLSQKEIAINIGCSRAAICRLLNGKIKIFGDVIDSGL